MASKSISSRLNLLMGLAVLAGVMSCGDNPLRIDHQRHTITGPGIPTSAITWVPWSPGALAQMDQMPLIGRIGFAGKMVTPQAGGTVGGNITFGNQVDISAGAVSSNTFVTVEALCMDGGDQCGAGVEFLPSMTFNTDVLVTLSWAFLDWDGTGDLNLQVYYSNNDGDTWYPVENPVVDYDQQTISVNVDHFTRYAWGLD